MTQENKAHMLAQNWFPSFKQNKLKAGAIWRQYFSDGSEAAAVYSGFGWTHCPQGDSYWRSVHKKLEEQGL